jgi:hypothetical protein
MMMIIIITTTTTTMMIILIIIITIITTMHNMTIIITGCGRVHVHVQPTTAAMYSYMVHVTDKIMAASPKLFAII